MKTLVVFREGLSGNYLKALINNSQNKINFRIDSCFANVYRQPENLEIDNIVGPVCDCFHKKYIDLTQIQKKYDLTVTIQVYQKIYHGIYNNFHKKLLIENTELKKNFQHWSNNLPFWYDLSYYNLKEYYQLYQQDLTENTIENIINFDFILDINYIEHVFQKYLNRPINNNTKRIVHEYRSKQMMYNLSNNETDMRDIISALPDDVFIDSPWFASYCIFKFEVNNNLSESQRQWSIESIDQVINKSTLLKISQQYN